MTFKKAGWFFVSVFLAALALSTRLPAGAEQSPKTNRKAVFLSLDGFPADLLDRGMVARHMPTLSQLISEGALATRSMSSFPSTTPPAHAALWTGAFGGVSGITGFGLLKLPAEESTILETISGFSSIPLEAEPIFVTAARQGLRTVVLAASHAYPFSAFFENGNFGFSAEERARIKENLTVFEIYAGRLGSDAVLSSADLRPVDPNTLPPGIPSGQVLGFRHALGLELEREPEESKYDRRSGRALLRGYWYNSSPPSTGSRPAKVFDRLKLELEVTQLETTSGEDRPAVPQIYSLEVPSSSRDFQHLSFRFFDLPASLTFRLFAARPNGSEFLLYISTPQTILSTHAGERDALFEKLEGIYGNGASIVYRQGRLGRMITRRGDGLAEERYLETALHLIDRLERLWQLATAGKEWNLVCAYVPYPDEILHTWYGWLDPNSPAYRPRLANQLAPYVARTLAGVDSYLSVVLRSLGPADYLIVTSDHGMRGITRLFYPNRLFREKGLLGVDAYGRLDLTKTEAYFSGTFSVLVNQKIRKQGAVETGDTDRVVQRVAEVLRSVRDPKTGKPVVNRVLLPGQEAAVTWGVGKVRSGDLFFDVARPYYAAMSYLRGPVTAQTTPAGAHGFYPDASDMLALMVLRGPGVDHLRSQGHRVLHTEAAPTLCDWLGIEPPRHATGRSLRR